MASGSPQLPVDTALQAAANELRTLEPSPFSPAAFEMLKGKIGEYIGALVVESVKMAKRHDADVVSPTYVEDANRLLISRAGRRWFRHLGTVGGILLGAALSNLLAMTTAEKYSAVAVLITAGVAVTGAFMVALHIGKD